jgi:pimeloyl-ACP methyl ester carboxylesterase
MKAPLQVFENDDQTIYYLLEGDESAPLVTLVNGYARTHTDFRIMSKRLLNSGYRVLSMDNRGSGKSVATKAFSLQEMALDVIALWDFLDVKETCLLGISMGGIISQYLSLHDARVSKLILVSTSPSKDYITPERVEFSEDFSEVHDKMMSYFHESFIEKNSVLIDAMVKQMVKSASQGDFVAQSKLQRSALNAFDQGSLNLADLDLETLVIHGKQDKVISLDAASDLSERIRGSVLKTYDNCGHLILAEKPSQFYEDVLEFLANK